MQTLEWKPRHYYILQHRLTGMRYIGQRVRNDVGTKYFGSGVYWKRHRKKYGWLDIDVLELEYFDNAQSAQQWLDKQYLKYGEYWINDAFANLRPETTEDQTSQKGFKHSDETKQRISLIRKGRAQSGGVKIHSEESRSKMSKSQTGKTLSEEDKLKKSKALKGKPKTEKHKQNMRKTKLKVNCPLCDRLLGSHNLTRHYNVCKTKVKNDN